MTKASFNIFNELSTWGQTLPVWQRCLLAKLVGTSEISDADLGLVYGELLIDFGLAAHDGARTDYTIAVPQFQDNAPQALPYLQLMHGVSGVNALASGEKLTFGAKLTVIYGPNGSGKSGYARVLKAACFTRSHETTILGDVRLNPVVQTEPTAKFAFGDGSDATYVYQQPCPRLRDNFAVFDSTCVRVHLDERKAFQVMPYLFDVFPRMVDAFGKIQTRLKTDIANRSPAADKFAIANSDSAVAQALAAVTAKTDLVTLSKLAVFGEVEDARLEEVGKKINELRSTDPKKLIQQNQQRLTDLQTLQTALMALATGFGGDLISIIEQEITKTQRLTEKSAALSAARFGNEPVQPVGTLAWRELIAAAIAYNQEAYKGGTFPPALADNPRCVLCQQELGAEALDRLTRFYQVATSDVENQLKASKIELETLDKKLSKANTGFFSAEGAARRSLKELDAALELDVAEHVAKIEATKLSLAGSIANVSVPTDKPLVDSVSQRIKDLFQRLTKENEDLELKDPKALIAPLLKEQKLLEDRKILAGKYADIVTSVSNLKWAAIGSAALRGFGGIQREVTTKQKVLVKALVAQGFIDSFTDNCKALKLDLPVQFRFAGDAGQTDRQIEIANASAGNFEPSDVLSEGEQTAAALADFLTEVDLNGSCAGVIFDDPVTSMDHIRKESIAQRLVAEAAARQVIIFTHDILFTNYLASAAEAQGVNFTGRTVWNCDMQEPGRVDVLAFPHEEYEGAAYDRAKKHLDEAKKLTGDAQRDQLEKACGKLRTAYEDFIQKKLFGNVVRRWRENIMFTLDQVYFDEKIALRVHERMATLSRFIDAHSHTPDHQQVPLTTTVVTTELADFDRIKVDYSAAKKVWDKAKPATTFD
ncbi:MAG: AAA family ATPase [Sinimarinibacterium sp.]|jgi:energy-coupling factor transporter ATP-binding protein EcfA2